MFSPLEQLYPPDTVRMTMGKVTIPWRFGIFEEEYAALREKAGLFDFSYLGRLSVQGKDAFSFLQERLARDIEYLMPERCLMSLFLDEEARPLDVVVVYNQEDHYLVETSPFGREEVFCWLRKTAPEGVTISDLTTGQAVIGLEGPYAWQVLGRVVDFEVSVLPYQGVLPASWEGNQLLVSRTGFSAEYGYKIYADPEVARRLWAELRKDTCPVGYQVLEAAMLEVRQPNLYREMAEDGTVIRCGLNWLVDLQKEKFTGKTALLTQREAGPDFFTVGFVAESGRELPAGSPVRVADLEIGRVVYAVTIPGLNCLLGLVRTQAEWTASGLEIQVRDAAGNWQPVKTVSAPYLIPKSWNVPIL